MNGSADETPQMLVRARRVRSLLRHHSRELSKIDPGGTPGLPARLRGDNPKAWSRAEVTRLGAHLGELQQRLFARAKAGVDRRRLLLVLQAIDCGGKDGTVRNVVGAMNPLGMRIQAFGPPTEEERAHNFLWRINRNLPQAGYVGVFNRSHYEDVLVVRVHGLVPRPVWKARYDEINRFEQDLAADGLVMVKVMLHISYEEQRKRLLARLDDPTKRWKFNPGDLDDRDLWQQYQDAYADMLTRCDTDHAPWYVVPADHRWYRNWAVTQILVAHLDEMDLRYPEVPLDLPALRTRLGESKANRR